MNRAIVSAASSNSRSATSRRLQVVLGWLVAFVMSLSGLAVRAQQSDPVLDEDVTVTSFTDATYPVIARAAKVQGAVVLDARLDAEGKVAAVQAGDDDAAAVVDFADVYYPPEARNAGIEGAVVIVATLNPDGGVVDASVESGPGALRQAALASVKDWTFTPGPSRGVIVYDFTLEVCRDRGAGVFRMYLPNLARITACRPPGVRASAQMDQRRVVATREVRYPTIAGAAQIAGAVVVSVDLNEAGQVVAASAVAGPAILRSPSVANARQWRFARGKERKATIVYDCRIEGLCHNEASSFTLRHPNVASIVRCGGFALP